MTQYQYVLKEYGDALIQYYKLRTPDSYNQMCKWQDELASLARFAAEN